MFALPYINLFFFSSEGEGGDVTLLLCCTLYDFIMYSRVPVLQCALVCVRNK